MPAPRQVVSLIVAGCLASAAVAAAEPTARRGTGASGGGATSRPADETPSAGDERDTSSGETKGPTLSGQDAPPVNQLGRVPSAGEFNTEAHLLAGVGLRERLLDRGVRVTGVVIADGLQVLDGPDERGEVRALGVLDFGLDTKRADWLPGGGGDDGTFFARLYAGTFTDGAEGFPEALVAIDTLPAFEQVVLGELWYEQRLLEDRLRLRAGRMDANSDFAYAEYAAAFITDSAAVSPTNPGIPSYLDPAVGALMFAYPGEWAFGLGVYRGDLALPDPAGVGEPRFLDVDLDTPASSTYVIAEAARGWNRTGGLPGEAKLGGWLAHGDFNKLDATSPSGNELLAGGYLIVQQALYDESGDGQGLGGFVQVGYTDEEYTATYLHTAAGLVYKGLLPGRDGDRCGVYVSRSQLSDFAGGFEEDDEWVIEATYIMEVTPWLQVQPDLQHILNAGGDRRDVTFAGLRVIVSL